jgi:hypothetical protein
MIERGDERLEYALAWSSILESPLTDKQRKDRLAEIDADMLATERQEERLIEEAERRGITTARRPDASPLAVLGLT